MAFIRKVLTTETPIVIIDSPNADGADAYLAAVSIFNKPTKGFGGGSVTLETCDNIDDGNDAVWLPIKNMSGNNIAVSSSDSFNIVLGVVSSWDAKKCSIRAKLTGAAAGAEVYVVFKNNRKG